MAQSEELNLLRGFGAKRQKEQVEHATDNEVEEGPQLTSDLMPSHRDDGSRRGRQSGTESRVKRRIGFSDTTSSRRPTAREPRLEPIFRCR